MSSPFQLRLFGTFDLRIDGASATGFRSDRARALLAYVAVEREQTHRREQLAALFWPDLPDAPAKANLRNVLSNLRALLGDGDASPLRVTRHDVRFLAEPAAVDVLAFAAALAQAQRTTVTPIDLLQRAVDLYAGDFLAGLFLDDAPDFQEWRVQRQERYHQQAMDCWERIATHWAAMGDYQRLAASARGQLGLTPWHEPAYRRLMEALAGLGMAEAALEQYDRCVLVLAEELGVEPAPETQALARQIRGAEEEVTAAHSGPPRRARSNIPLIATSFLGRESDSAAAISLCRPGQERLVTLLGIGGVGKTRLAIAVGQQLQPDFDDGVRWVSLEGVQPGDNSANRLAVAIAAGLGLALGRAGSVQEQLLDYLRERRLLLILDNFEGLVAHADFLLSLLSSAPGLHLLVTSRQRLNLPGERLLRVSGLPTEEGVALFASRAGSISTHFALDDENRAAVAEICRLVEGLPLGIELAASWTEHFTPAEIAGAVAENRAVLRRDPISDPTGEEAEGQRHDSLRTVYEHSWQLLPANEQRALAQLSLFRGEFSRGAVLAIADAGLSELSALLAKSLVRLVGAGQYTVHEVVRAFSAEKFRLRAGSEQTESLHRYRTYYLQRVQEQPVAVLQRELADILAGWQSAVSVRDIVLLTGAASGFSHLLKALGLAQDGVELLRAALSALSLDGTDPQAAPREDRDADPATRRAAGLLLLEFSELAGLTSSLDVAIETARRGLLYADTPALRAQLYGTIARSLAESRSWEEVEAVFAEAFEEIQRSGDRMLLAQLLCDRAGNRVLHFAGDYAQSLGEMEQALALVTEEIAAETPARAQAEKLRFTLLGGLSTASNRCGDYIRALGYAQQVRALAEAQNDRFEQLEALIDLGQACCFARRHADAIAYASEGLALAEATGDQEAVGLLGSNLCLIHRVAGHPAQAIAYGEAALPTIQSLKNRRMEGQCRNRLGHALLALGRAAEAEAMFRQALAVWDALENPNRYEALAGHAAALLALGRAAEAAVLVEEVLAFAIGDAPQRVIEPMLLFRYCVQVLTAGGESARARAVQAQAQAWVERIAARNTDPAVGAAYRAELAAFT